MLSKKQLKTFSKKTNLSKEKLLKIYEECKNKIEKEKESFIKSNIQKNIMTYELFVKTLGIEKNNWYNSMSENLKNWQNEIENLKKNK